MLSVFIEYCSLLRLLQWSFFWKSLTVPKRKKCFKKSLSFLTSSKNWAYFYQSHFAMIFGSSISSFYSNFFARFLIKAIVVCTQSITQRIVTIIFNIVKVVRNGNPTHWYSVWNTMQDLRENMSPLKSLTRKGKHCMTLMGVVKFRNNEKHI